MDFSTFNADGSFNDGTPRPRPNTTIAEEEMDAFDKASLPQSPQEDRPGWISRQWDRISFQNAKPGDNVFQSMWGELSEAGSSFMAGLTRSGYNYTNAAEMSAEYVADKMGLEYEAKNNFLSAAKNKLRNMQMEPTTEEWEDQLMYLIGQLAPDVAMLVTGTGIVGGAVSLGTKAAGFGKSAAGISNILARITSDVALNTTQVLAHEAAQAELDGREAEYGQAGKDAIVMAALMSTTARASRAFGLNRKSTALLTGATLGGATSMYYDDNDPQKADAVAANAVLGGLFGLAVPQTQRVGAQDIQKWVGFKKQAADAPKSMGGWIDSYTKEFMPETHKKEFDSQPKREEKLNKNHWDEAENMSPKDEFLLFLSQATGKNTFGYNDNNIIQLIADLGDQHSLGEYKLLTDPSNPNAPGGGRPQQFELRSGADRSASLKEAKVLMDAMNETNADWLKDRPSYKPKVDQPTEKAGPQYETRKNLKRTSDTSQERMEGIIAIDKDTGQPLQAHQLSWKEYMMLEGDSPANKEFHMQEIIAASKRYNPKQRGRRQTWPNKGALIEHDLWGAYGYIHSKPDGGFRNKGISETGRMLANRTKQDVLENQEQAHRSVKQVLEENNPSWVDSLYKWMVDPGARVLNMLETQGFHSVRNAKQLDDLKKGKAEQKMRELDDQIDFWNMSKDEDALIASYIFLNAETDNVKRLGHDPPVRREIDFKPENVAPALAALRDDAKSLPGGWKAVEKKIKVIEDFFGDMFEHLHESGIVGRKTYDILSEYKYTPQKTINEAMSKYQDHVLEVRQKEGKLDVTDSALHDLQIDAKIRGKHTNLESLMAEHIHKVYGVIAKNELFSEMAKIDNPDYWSLTKPKDKFTGEPDLSYNKHSFVVDGEPTPIWVEKKLSTLLQAKSDRFMGPNLKRFLRFVTGVQPIQLSAVALNPVFAVGTHPLDLWSIATHHKDLPKFVPKVVKDMYVYNNETGSVPMLKNFRHAWNRDDVYKRYVENDGVVSTLISSISANEMFAKSADLYDRTKTSSKFKRGWNNAITAIGKFGHTMEVAMRMTEVDMLVNTGKYSAKEAAHESLRRLNYGRRGQAMDFFDSLIPFANAQAQILSSQMNEVKTPKGRARVANTVAQLTAGIALTRVLMEEAEPGLAKEISLENRMRYWIVPIPGITEVDHKTAQERKVYLKIKKAYNPFFMIANLAAEVSLDAYYYGKDNLPPMSSISMIWDALKVASPVEIQNNFPPIAKALLAWIGDQGADISLRPVYKGPKVLMRDEVNTEKTGGKKTHESAVALGQLTGLSPARLEKTYDSYVARNPLAWFAGSWLDTPTHAQQSTVKETLKLPIIRSFTGLSDKRWAEYESGDLAQKQAGSNMYNEYHTEMLAPLSKLYDREINNKQFLDQVKAIASFAKPNIKIKMLNEAQKEVKAKVFMDKLLVKHSANEVYDHMQTYAFWNILRIIQDPDVRAERYFDRWSEIEDPYWSKQFKKMAAVRGLYQDRFFAAKVKQLQKRGY